MNTTAVDLVNRYYGVISAGDWAAYPSLFTEDAELQAPGGMRGVGPAAMLAFDQVWKNALPDFTVSVQRQTASESGGTTVLMSENVAHGTQTGDLVTPQAVFPATGSTLTGPYVGIFEIRDGRIAAQRIYFDRMDLVEQLGLVPSPAGA